MKYVLLSNSIQLHFTYLEISSCQKNKSTASDEMNQNARHAAKVSAGGFLFFLFFAAFALVSDRLLILFCFQEKKWSSTL